jgi:hypothetical protein
LSIGEEESKAELVCSMWSVAGSIACLHEWTIE